MNERKNIDKLFQEKFKDFEQSPPEQSWPELERRLKQKNDRKIVPIWWRLSGIAAALLIGFLIVDQIGLFSYTNETDNRLVIEENAKETIDPNSTNGIENGKNPPTDAIVNADSSTTIENPIVETSSSQNGSPDKTEKTIESGHENANPNNAVADAQKNRNTSGEAATVKKKKAVKNGIPYSESKTAVADSDRKGNTRKINASENSEEIANHQNRSLKQSENANGKTNPFKKSLDPDPAAPNESGIAHKPTLEPANQNKIHQAATNTAEQIAAKNTTDKKSSETATIHQKTELNKDNTTNINHVAVAEDKNQKKLDSTAIAMTVPNALEELLNEKENKVTKEKEPKLNRWQLTSNVAPIYFGSTSGGSPIDSTFANNSKDYNTQVSYGIGASYAISKKLAIRTGINKVSLSYDTNDVLLYAGLDSEGLGNVDMPDGNGTLNFGRLGTQAKSTKANRTNAIAAEGNLSTEKFSGTINQKMGYIEVPLELSYMVVDRKFGVNIIAGVSTLFLNDNKIVLTSEGLTTDLGEANNLNKTHFSSNIGLGLKYRFLKSFEANFEPIFKYQLNTFSKDSGDFKPYFFGLYTGVSFRF